MQAIWLQNTIYKGRRYAAGESADLPENVARRAEKDGLAHVQGELAPDMPEIEPKPAQNAPQTKKAGKTPPKPKVAKKGAK